MFDLQIIIISWILFTSHMCNMTRRHVQIMGTMYHVPYPLNNMILVVDQFRKYITTIIKVEWVCS